jgi:6-hydroxycyclohex-1-ene-1-carbonyl-CoA dehydrogenase
VNIDGHAWVLEEAGKPLVKRSRRFEAPADGLALLEVVGCGVCHTDLGFADGGVAPVQKLPIVLGHEIVGRVLDVGSSSESLRGLVGRRVLAPAVSPCGDCPTCQRGRKTACPSGRMPGNHADGGFATHTYVPARDVLALDAAAGSDAALGEAGLEAWEIAPIADAGTTAYQAIERCGLGSGDVAVFVGAGGVGGFGIQLAKAAGASVFAVDVDPRRLEAYAQIADETLDATDRDPREVRKALRKWIDGAGLRGRPLRVFETSGTPAGQTLAFTLVDRGGSLSIVGFTPEKVPLRLSNVMALDADVFGNWGCDPALYSAVMEPVLDGRVKVREFVERFALDDANAVLDRMRSHDLERRAVLVP